MRAAYWFIAAAMLALLCGCGGGGSSSDVPVSVAIHWAARSRVLNSPSSALSVRITLLGAGAAGGDVTLSINRRADPAEYVATEMSTAIARSGSWELRADFFSQANGQGAIVGTAITTVLVKPGKPLMNTNETPLGSIATTGNLTGISIIPWAQQLTVGRELDLQVSVTGKNGEVVALSPGSVFFEADMGQDSLQVDPSGHVRGLKPGVVNVIAKLDDLLTTQGLVYILPDIDFRTISLPANDLAYDPITKRIYASVPSAGPGVGNAVAVIDPVTGAYLQSVNVGSEPDRMAISDDGQFLYVALDGASAVKRLKLPALSPDLIIPVGGPTGGAPRILDIAVPPGSPRALVVSMSGLEGNPAESRVAIFDDAVQRPNSIESQDYNGAITSLAFSANGSQVYGSTGIYEGDLAILSVNAGGLTKAVQVNGLLGQQMQRLLLAGEWLYCANGRIIDPVSSTVTGTLPTGFSQYYQPPAGFAVDATLGRAYYANLHYSVGVDIRWQSFETSTFLPLGQFDIPIRLLNGDASISRVVRWGPGTGGFAVLDRVNPLSSQIVLLSRLPN